MKRVPCCCTDIIPGTREQVMNSLKAIFEFCRCVPGYADMRVPKNHMDEPKKLVKMHKKKKVFYSLCQ